MDTDISTTVRYASEVIAIMLPAVAARASEIGTGATHRFGERIFDAFVSRLRLTRPRIEADPAAADALHALEQARDAEAQATLTAALIRLAKADPGLLHDLAQIVELGRSEGLISVDRTQTTTIHGGVHFGDHARVGEISGGNYTAPGGR